MSPTTDRGLRWSPLWINRRRSGITRTGHDAVAVSGYDLTAIQVRRPSDLLNPGDKFPSITLPIIGGETINLPGDLAGSWAYIAFYRGHW